MITKTENAFPSNAATTTRTRTKKKRAAAFETYSLNQ